MKTLDTGYKKIIPTIEKTLQDKISTYIKIEKVSPVYGGDINRSFKVVTNQGIFFLKLNDAVLYPDMFEKEAHGLMLLRKTDTVYIPEVIATGTTGHEAFLLTEYIDICKRKSDKFWENFGIQLAEMHRNTNKFYGLDEDNYIGSLMQINTPDDSWVNFYIEKRLKPQIKLAVSNKKIDAETVEKFELLFDKLYNILPDELPHLLHGDLWSGNLIALNEETPVLIDPAVYYGNREVDLAMTRLFGGFDEMFYTAYNDAYPLLPGWEERVPVYQLYPLMVHLNLFGGSYRFAIEDTLRLFI